jgi:hypothetical protein
MIAGCLGDFHLRKVFAVNTLDYQPDYLVRGVEIPQINLISVNSNSFLVFLPS